MNSSGGDEHYTTGKIARMLKLAPRTVTKWCDKGLLPSYRIPPGRDRRIVKSDLVEFIKANRFPMPRALAPTVAVAFGLRAGELPTAERPGSVLAIGSLIERAVIDVAVIGDAEGVSVAVDICNAIRDKHHHAWIVLVLDESAVVAAKEWPVSADVVQVRPVVAGVDAIAKRPVGQDDRRERGSCEKIVAASATENVAAVAVASSEQVGVCV